MKDTANLKSTLNTETNGAPLAGGNFMPLSRVLVTVQRRRFYNPSESHAEALSGNLMIDSGSGNHPAVNSQVLLENENLQYRLQLYSFFYTLKSLHKIYTSIGLSRTYDNLLTFSKKAILQSHCLAIWAMAFFMPISAYAIDHQQLATAIYHAEGGTRTKHPYGILKHYKRTTPRQACLNTIRSADKRFNQQTKEKDFVVFLSRTYCPVGAKNDPRGLNKNWVKNVKHFLREAKCKTR